MPDHWPPNTESRMSNFAFLATELPEIFDSAKRAEFYAASDPRTAAFHARRTVELAVQWAYTHDSGLRFPYDDRISALIHEPSFIKRAGGMPNATGKGYVDYVLWGDDGKPLAVVEAKKHRRRPPRRPAAGQALCRLPGADARPAPADLLQQRLQHLAVGRQAYPPRQVAGFYNKEALARLMTRRTQRQALDVTQVKDAIAGRYYQKRAIGSLNAQFGKALRKALLVMATGTGKTRTAIALVDQLQRAGWVKRALFLADRVSLVNRPATPSRPICRSRAR
jgi:hypothetical protein